MMRYGIFSIFWAAASRGSVSGSGDPCWDTVYSCRTQLRFDEDWGQWLWPSKATPLHLHLRCFYFVSIDETPTMGIQRNLASRSEVVSIYKCFPKKFGSFRPNLGRKTIKFWTTFSRLPHSTSHISGTKRRQTKMLVSIYNMSFKSWPAYRDLSPRKGWDPERLRFMPTSSPPAATCQRIYFQVAFGVQIPSAIRQDK